MDPETSRYSSWYSGLRKLEYGLPGEVNYLRRRYQTDVHEDTKLARRIDGFTYKPTEV